MRLVVNGERIPILREIQDNGGTVNVTLEGVNTPPLNNDERTQVRSFRILKMKMRGDIPILILKYALKVPEEYIEVEITKKDYDKIKDVFDLVFSRPENQEIQPPP